ncbi:MAG: SRPBCC domain-containing protein [Anaerolineae bacterium]|nr:SRPBCC domain-containing protein [Anaerolineae bacterium]
MTFQPDPQIIQWRMHFTSPPEKVYQMLTTDEGRAKFWAESAIETEDGIQFIFPGDYRWLAKILAADPPHRFSLEYYGGSKTSFLLAEDGSGGTDLTLTDEGVPPADRWEVTAGWVSVLMALKAAVDFSVDLRNHDPDRTWQQEFANN